MTGCDDFVVVFAVVVAVAVVVAPDLDFRLTLVISSLEIKKLLAKNV